VDRYMLRFDKLQAMALSPDDTRTTLKRQME
jgi:hypothetical protein